MDNRHANAIVTEIVEGFGYDFYSVTHTYSGRGMYGEKTSGVIGPSALLIAFVAGTLHGEDVEGMEDMCASELKMDSMGRNVVVY